MKFIKIKNIYLDNAAATPVDKKVIKAMAPFYNIQYANPSAIHSPGLKVKEAINGAKKIIANILNCRKDELIFCSGGTESDNLTLFGIAQAYKEKGNHILISAIEHPAVTRAAEKLKAQGFEIEVIPVDKKGLINPKDVFNRVKDSTILVSIMYANNEIGTIQPIDTLSRQVKKWKRHNKRSEFDPPFFHTDACQASPYLDLDVKKLAVDLMTLNGSKMYGPKGIGLLYKKRNIKLEPMLYGGEQEMGFRSGTENVQGIIGFSTALKNAHSQLSMVNGQLSKLRDHLIVRILHEIPNTTLNGHPTHRLPNNINISFNGVESESLVIYLDRYGITCSTGSACQSDKAEPSSVILALENNQNRAQSSVRFSLGKATTKRDLDRAIKYLKRAIDMLRIK